MGEGTAARNRPICLGEEEVVGEGDRADHHREATQPTDPLDPQFREAPWHTTLSTERGNS